MPQLLKKEGSPYWVARFQINGKDYWRSTKKTKKSEAQDAMFDMIAAEKGNISVERIFENLILALEAVPKEDQLPQKQSFAKRLLHGTSSQMADSNKWQDVQDVIISYLSRIKEPHEADKIRRKIATQLLQGQSTKLLISESWQSWTNSPRKRNPGDRTMEGYSAIWKRFEKWISNQVQFLHEITPTMAEDYAADLWDSHVSPGTYNAHIKFLRSMFNIIENRAGLLTNIWRDIPMMEKEQEGRRNLTPEELAKVCQRAKGSMRYMIAVGLYTGMRLGDVVNLRWDAVRLKDGVIEIMPMKTRRMNKKVRLPIHPVLRVLLNELRTISRGDYLFPEDRKVYLVDQSAITKQIQAFFQNCGITTQEQSTNGHRRRAIVRVGFHSLRHSFVSLCAANSVPQVAIMELVGHGSPAMTALYSHAGDEQKAKASAGLPALSFKSISQRRKKAKRK